MSALLPKTEDAIDEELNDAVAPVTKVRIHRVNTGKVIVAEDPVRGNKAEVEGNHVIIQD
ncbi:MAG: hypothetical protein FJ122_14725 [Deltaproteobacteria bacterium]|nr:hypothetical protein [Deltaproteobacteria bacterium]